MPQPELQDFALLQIVSVHSFGVFLQWGLDNLLMPNREMTEEFRFDVRPGGQVVVHLFVDSEGRPTGSMRLANFVDPDTSQMRVGQAVELLFFEETELGYTAIVNNRHMGVVYHSEVFREIGYGDRLPGYIKKIRPDGKLDLILQPLGTRGSGDLGQQILDQLEEAGGFLPLTDKTDPEVIYQKFGVSKKKFKMALGGIYRQQLVHLDADGIHLVNSNGTQSQRGL